MDSTLTAVTDRLTIYRDPHPVRIATFGEDVRRGLTAIPKTLAAKYFYDDLGSSLFESITRLPEYYLTRVERDLLATYGREIVASFGEPLELLELGSGSATKTRIIIEAILEKQKALKYHPIEISLDALMESSLALIASHERLVVQAYAADYFSLLRQRELATQDRVLALYLGSNIGNFEPHAARTLLELLASALKTGDGLLVGYDLKKDATILEAAYDDPTGVTSAFNKNLLARINREFDGDFDLHQFRFKAKYDPVRGCVDSFLVSMKKQQVALRGLDLSVSFAEDEPIHTESSYKFTPAEIVALAHRCGFIEKKTFTDAAGRYALSLLLVA
jgi:L-histidine N-alpha-methyltransferase